jgi:histidine triad (HIT) family protein
MSECLFCRIVAGEIPAEIVHQTDEVVAFRDIAPQAPTHVLIVPRIHVPTVNDLTPEHANVVGNLFLAAATIAAEAGFARDGYRLVMNCNQAAGQTVWHLHLHLLGGRSLTWPPG